MITLRNVDPVSGEKSNHAPSQVSLGDHRQEREASSSVTTPYVPVERPTYGDLLSDPQRRRWLARGVIAVSAGLVVTLLFNWRLGLTAAVLTAIAHSVYYARRQSSIPAWRKPSAAERRTERQLRALEKSGYKALHARAIPGSESSIDHLVAGPTGVYAIDSEGWDTRLPVRSMPNKLYHGPFSKKDRLTEAAWEAKQASELISQALGTDIDVRPSLAIYGPTVPWDILKILDVDVFTGRKVRKWLRKGSKDLAPSEIDRIMDIAERVLPPKY